MVYDFTNPIYILLMILLFGVPIVTPVIYGQYRSTTTGFDLEGQLMLGLLFILFLGAYGTILLLGIFPTATAQGAGAGAPGEYSGRYSLIPF